MTVKHATASSFVFGSFPTGWRLGLIQHPRLHRKMIMGGRVEQDETQEQAVLREVVDDDIGIIGVPAGKVLVVRFGRIEAAAFDPGRDRRLIDVSRI